ncbi:hypothetical protein [Engelhardtia mirabilis]|uniref:Type II secretion system protein GspE N-terminal domain-containing protein n=1 Tax=Engelhardtia mirabilis TaxID=2528011 RepID=A0A518BD92_9BACT|nr:hypothetical protein Pla133_00050 [Planctomycetes bacterium Pla133]QDU99270.1 hypothetical protein Pla86_00050 [Planctomycetes bacterium Pla86]
MKQTQRLDYERLADSIRDRQIIDGETIRHTLHEALSTGALFTELLVRQGLLSDWELCRIASEVFNLAFVPVDLYEPNEELIGLFDSEYLRQYCLVPLDRFGDLVTIAMPAMVPSEILQELEDRHKVKILGLVGSVGSNQSWLERHLPAASLADLSSEFGDVAEGGEWGGIFDAGDAAVQEDL